MNVYITPEEYEAAAARGISRKTLNLRVRIYGWPKDRALTEPPQPRTDWSEWYAIAEQNGISHGTFRARVRKGWSPQRAAVEPVWTMQQKVANMQARRNKRRKYPPKIYELMRKSGVNYYTFATRVRNGWPPEQAATAKPSRYRAKG